MKQAVEAHEDYRPALVATRPGWLDGLYVFGDGTYVAPRSDSAARFQAAFPDHEAMMRALRDADHARTEGGLHPKLTIKTSRAIRAEGRAYCIRLASGA